VSEDDQLMARLAALEAEVKADADAQKERKEAAMVKVREQRASQLAEREALRPKAKPEAKARPTKATKDDDDDRDSDKDSELDSLGGALALAKQAHGVKQELARGGEKSWVRSGVASLLLGPIGWLYAGSFRESIPASAAWLAFAALASKLPTFLLMPVFLVALPLSAIAGVVYAMQYNRTGSRQRLFKDKKQLADKPKKQLKGG